jgi:hypothetical protein
MRQLLNYESVQIVDDLVLLLRFLELPKNLHDNEKYFLLVLIKATLLLRFTLLLIVRIIEYFPDDSNNDEFICYDENHELGNQH